MVTKRKNGSELSLMLLQESLWNLEDKINVILEGTANHDAELVRLKQLTNLILERLGKLETQEDSIRRSGGTQHG